MTVMLLEDTPAVLSLGKLCEDHEFCYHWTSGQKPRLIQNGRKIECNAANYTPFVVLALSTSSSNSSSLKYPTSQEAATPTEHPASTRSENISPHPWGPGTPGSSALRNQHPKSPCVGEERRACLGQTLPAGSPIAGFRVSPVQSDTGRLITSVQGAVSFDSNAVSSRSPMLTSP